MAHVAASFVRQTTSTTGTGVYELNDAPTGYQTFVAGIGNGNTCPYGISDGTDREVGIGTVASGSPDTLTRTVVLASSNGGSAVSWSLGNKTIICAPLGELLGLYEDGAVGTPSISFRQDPNTGLYRPGADQLALALGGVAKWTWASDGRATLNVGSTLANIYTQIAFAFGGGVAEGAVLTSGTGATVIGSVSGRACKAIVGGRDSAGVGSRFFADEIIYGSGPMGPGVTNTLDGGSSPATRAYSISGTDLRVAMGTDHGGYAIGITVLFNNRG
jgi:hypothetical protein